MLYAIAALTLLNVALVAVLCFALRQAARERSDRASAYERTLQTMADRVQAPDRLPVTPMPTFDVPERELDEWARVGQVDVADDYGLSDDDG